tara:strand:+ start:3538 stop:3837 length:300 start_codon:yes stop_codon:yes gene_type:complete
MEQKGNGRFILEDVKKKIEEPNLEEITLALSKTFSLKGVEKVLKLRKNILYDKSYCEYFRIDYTGPDMRKALHVAALLYNSGIETISEMNRESYKDKEL